MIPKNIARKIWEDLTDRCGFDTDIDDETLNEILDAWAEIIEKEVMF